MAQFKVNMTPAYKGASYANNRVIVEGARATFTVGAVKRGEEARQVNQGPLVPGPWAYAFGNAVVIDNHGGSKRDIEKQRAEGVLVECKLTDTLIIHGDEYAISFADGGRDKHNIKLTLVPKETGSLAKVVTKTLTDGSEVYNVELFDADKRVAIVGAECEATAQAIAVAINRGAVWVEVDEN